MTDEIQTSRLVLRPYRDADAVVLTRLINDPRIYRNVGRIPPGQPVEETRRIQRERAVANAAGKSAGFCAYLGDELVGMAGGGESPDTGLIDFGYWIAPDHWGKGFATEAGAAVLLCEWPDPLLDWVGERLEFLILPEETPDVRRWHLRGTPAVPAAWNALLEETA